MVVGKSFKSSVAVSVVAHAALVAALLLIAGSAVEEKRRVFFVELEEARLVSAEEGGAEAKKSAPAPSEARPVKHVIVEKTSPPAPEAKEERALKPEPAAGDMTRGGETAPDASGGATLLPEGSNPEAHGGQGGALDAGFESFALSSGPGPARADALAKIRKAIEEELTYPPLARRRKIEGTVVAGFSIDGKGAPRDIKVVRSSGFSVLDNEVVEIIRRAAPYPRVPERVEVPVSFKLVEGR